MDISKNQSEIIIMEVEENTQTTKLKSCAVDEYLFTVNCIADLKINELRDWVLARSGIKVADIKIKDLVFHKGKPVNTGNGVYIFKEGSEILYVGKCSSRVFSERIPAHFDLRKHAWFNSLLVNLISKDLQRRVKSDKTDENLLRFAQYAFDNLELILINFSTYDKVAINKLESLCRAVVEPINCFKRKKVKNQEMFVSEYIGLIKKVETNEDNVTRDFEKIELV